MLEVCWRYPAHQQVHTSAFWHSRYIAAVRNTKLVCLDIASGAELWRTNVKGSFRWIAVTEQAVFYLSGGHFLVALAIETGRGMWSRTLLEEFYGWLHASSDTVVVGGWRGYTDLLCLNAADGTTRWSYPARHRLLHRTSIDPVTQTVVLAVPTDASLHFLDLANGREVHRLTLPGIWTQWTCERIPLPLGTTAPSLILNADEESFFCIVGDPPQVEQITVGRPIWSRNLVPVGDLIPFMSGRILMTHSVTTRENTELGPIDHNRGDLLPFITLTDGSMIVGTSFGMLYLFGPTKQLVAKRKVGKSVPTTMGYAGTHICCGTGSGEILGLQLR